MRVSILLALDLCAHDRRPVRTDRYINHNWPATHLAVLCVLLLRERTINQHGDRLAAVGAADRLFSEFWHRAHTISHLTSGRCRAQIRLGTEKLEKRRSTREILMNPKFWIVLILLAVAGCSGGSGGAGSEGEAVSFASIVEKSEYHEGFFDVYRDKKSGETYLAIKTDQVDQEFIYNAVVTDGVVESFTFRGAFGDNKIISVRRHFNRIEFVTENTAFYFDPNNALSRASEANISNAILAVQDIVAENEEDGTVLIKADDVFLKESLQQLKGPPNPDPEAEKRFELGTLSEVRNKIYEVRSYPENTNVFVDYVFENPAPLVPAQEDVTDSRFVSIRLQHSFVKVPDNDYQPRIDDPRVGYFLQYITDLTSPSHTPYRDLIMRWDLRKKDPDAALSEPVEPIVWWIENTTPVEIRDTITEGALAWNHAFEKAGFENAVQVKVQPDDADWDAGDIRYNVLRWTSSPQPPFGGYGPAFTNPRTGQIIGADVMLEYVYLTNRIKIEDILELIAGGQTSDAMTGRSLHCSLGHRLQLGNIFGTQALKSMGASGARQAQLIDESTRWLILHEIGHTLGLNHNMRASQIHTIDELSDAEFVAENGVAGSVMDYPLTHLTFSGGSETAFHDVRPGAYDDWAIEFGYSPELDGPDGEANRAALLDRSTEARLVFGNDADDMRTPGAGIDPRVNIGDMSADAISYASNRMNLASEIIGDLRNRVGVEGESYQQLLNSYLVMFYEYANAGRTISRYIGGVRVNRAMIGQPGATTPLVPVSLQDQKRAMTELRSKIFAPTAFPESDELFSHLRQQRRDFDFYGLTEDPKLHELVLATQKSVLDHLLNPVVLRRISDSRQYGNEYPLGDVVEDLTNAIFSDDMPRNVNTYRQNLQLEYVNRLVTMVSGDKKAQFDYLSQSTALQNLRDIENALVSNPGINGETRAHRANILYTIERGLDP